MKKILILIVGIALYLHFYPQPEINTWYESKKAEFLDVIAKSTKVTFKANLDEVYEELITEFKSFSNPRNRKLKGNNGLYRRNDRLLRKQLL